ncbi:hypothetical protein D3C71_2154080 [compost metagenome]
MMAAKFLETVCIRLATSPFEAFGNMSEETCTAVPITASSSVLRTSFLPILKS